MSMKIRLMGQSKKISKESNRSYWDVTWDDFGFYRANGKEKRGGVYSQVQRKTNTWHKV